MKKFFRFCLLLLIVGPSACKTNLVHLTVQEPAPVTIPPYVKTVGIINRSLTSEKNKALDVLDKVLSAEGPVLDKEGAEEGVAGLKNELVSINRFSEVKNLDKVVLKTVGAGTFPVPLDWATVEKVCMENNVDALFSLEAFDTETKVAYSTATREVKTPLGTVPTLETQATISTLIKTGWRIYDPKSKAILDEFSIAENQVQSGRGLTPVAAVAAVAGRKEAVKRVSNQIGQRYAYRIVPVSLRVSREYYVKGNNSFEAAKRKAQTGNWDGAAELWKKETLNSNSKIAGRAHYNMAIIAEINGDLDKGIEWAKKSYEDYGNKLALRYINILKSRKAKNARLELQQRREE